MTVLGKALSQGLKSHQAVLTSSQEVGTYWMAAGIWDCSLWSGNLSNKDAG